jgi:hypothetical protein
MVFFAKLAFFARMTKEFSPADEKTVRAKTGQAKPERAKSCLLPRRRLDPNFSSSR